MIKRFLYIVVFLFGCLNAQAQGYSYYEDTQFDMLQRQMYRIGVNTLHSSLRTYSLDELNAVFNVDSVLYAGFNKPASTSSPWRRFWQNFLWDDWLSWRKDGIYVAINPLFDFQVGKDGDRNTYINSRGFYLNGNLGKNFWFYMDFSENQADMTEYENHYADEYQAVAGQSSYKPMSSGYDYEIANGYIAFRIGKYLDFQIGKGKVFVGDGYRSFLISDFATSFWNVKYMFMLSQLRGEPYYRRNFPSNNGRHTKYAFTHYLDLNFGGRVSVGIFENVVMCTWRVDGDHRSIDLEYINPFIILRPGEYNAGSPDKMLVGMNLSWNVAKWLTLHGQVMLNEFNGKELFGGDNFWSNKYGFLLGLKTFNLFRVDGLDMQMEYSRVRPFSYSQYDGMGTYTHNYQPLAHPLEANFHELVGIMQYRHKRLYMRGQVNIAKYGENMDFKNDSISYGKNPNIPSRRRNDDYGIKMFQGRSTNQMYAEAQIAWLINPRSRLNIALNFRYRHKENDVVDETSKHVSLALRWGLKSWYRDY